MKETSTNLQDRIRFWAKSNANGGNDPHLLPLSNPTTGSPSLRSHPSAGNTNNTTTTNITTSDNAGHKSNTASGVGVGPGPGPGGDTSAQPGPSNDAGDGDSPSPITSPEASGPRPVVEPGGQRGTQNNEKQQEQQNDEERSWANIGPRFVSTLKMIWKRSIVNWLLVFVPFGFVVHYVPNLNPGLVFGINAVAIIPLAGLLAFATESVALKLGDAMGAMLNITFGNAVELIIFIIALTKDEIRIVQASLLGSILANLLLILGMSFLLGGLRYREQIYNSTVTQMSACLLSLSVISLVLPTAFHASFNDSNEANSESLKISRGTSIILLVVYIIYLLFQMKSHAYMYKSTPQHIIDEESTPGPVANWLDNSSSDSSSSDDSDSDDSEHSRETMSRRVRRAIRAARRRKSSVVSMETSESVVPTRTPSFSTADISPMEPRSDDTSTRPRLISHINSSEGHEEAVDDEKPHRHHRYHRYSRKKHRKHKKRTQHQGSQEFLGEEIIDENTETQNKDTIGDGEPRRVDFALSDVVSHQEGTVEETNTRRPFTSLRGMSLRPVAKSLAPTVFVQPPNAGLPTAPSGPVPHVRFGIRRTNSLPDRLNNIRYTGAMMPSQAALMPAVSGPIVSGKADDENKEDHLSSRAAILLLLVTTSVTALCADYMVEAIDGMVATSGVKEIFIGLIILPIVGNAAEHVTAITVAMKNKMDLAIGVAVGSSIQIALFITPLIVILGWAMGKEMTLYFTLFETVCLFVSTFIVNFLVLDGRSNYLEGALLCATYVIIGVVAFFYPNTAQASTWGQGGQ